MLDCPHCGAKNPDDSLFCGGCGKRIADTGPAAGLPTISAMETIDTYATNHGKAAENVELAPGTEFAGRYVIEAVLGKGGMGVVYRAHDKLVDKAIALKLIRRDRLGGEGAVKRLIAEGVTTRDIRHDHVVAVYDVGEAEGQPFVSMEYIEAVSLRDWHRKQVQERRDVPLPVAARIIAEVLKGLEAAHDKGVIHRDLKPENILLTDDPTAERAPLKIVDFGIARAAGAAVDSGTGTGLGTPRYMAPEQITNPDSTGPSADLYSISIIFYELLVDVLPQGHWQPPSGGRSDIPAAIDKLIEKGLSNRAASRPQSAAEYRQLLGQAISGYMPQPGGGGIAPVAGASSAKPLKWIAIGGGALLALVVIGIAVDEMDTGPGAGTVPVPPVSLENPYASLNGTWNSQRDRISYSVMVGPDGSFSVQDQTGSLSGVFNGNVAQVTISTAMGQTGGVLTRTDANHLQLAINGQVADMYHINHPPD